MTIDAFPTPTPVRTQAQEVFSPAMDAFLAHLPTFVTQANALAAGLNFPGLMSTSTTSVLIGTGSKAFTIQTGKTYVPNQSIIIQYTTTPTNWMYGTVTSYDSATGALVVNVTSTLGSGTYALWTIALAEPLVSALGFSMSGGINEARGSVAMHATTMNLWTQPNIIDGTGSAVTITAIANAPQAGARRVLYPITGTVITHGATFDVQGGASYTIAAGEALEFEAVTISTYKVRVIADIIPPTKSGIQNQEYSVFAAGGSTPFNTLTLTPAPAITAYVSGQSFLISAPGTNTGAVTIAISGLAAQNITYKGRPLIYGDLNSGHLYRITYESSAFSLEKFSTQNEDARMATASFDMSSATGTGLSFTTVFKPRIWMLMAYLSGSASIPMLVAFGSNSTDTNTAAAGLLGSVTQKTAGGFEGTNTATFDVYDATSARQSFVPNTAVSDTVINFYNTKYVSPSGTVIFNLFYWR